MGNVHQGTLLVWQWVITFQRLLPKKQWRHDVAPFGILEMESETRSLLELIENQTSTSTELELNWFQWKRGIQVPRMPREAKEVSVKERLVRENDIPEQRWCKGVKVRLFLRVCVCVWCVCSSGQGQARGESNTADQWCGRRCERHKHSQLTRAFLWGIAKLERGRITSTVGILRVLQTRA